MKFKGILMCTDLDGTLLRNDKTISPENIEAIEYFKSEGGLFTFITGRMPYFPTHKYLYETIKPNAPIGCINGGGLYDVHTKDYIWTRPISQSVLELVEAVDKNFPEIAIQVNTFDVIYFHKHNSVIDYFINATKIPYTTLHYSQVKEPIAKIVFCVAKEEEMAQLKLFLDSHPKANQFDFIRSEETLYEILPKGSNKGSVLCKLADFMNIDINKTIALGDYNNDVDMLRQAKLGIAVSNATAEAMAVADYITVSNEEHAIAKTVSDLENGILKI